MKRIFRAVTAWAFGIFLFLASHAVAAEKSTFVVLPFAVQGSPSYAYLERSIPQMLTSRLYWKGRVEPVLHDVPRGMKPVADQAAAEKARAQYKADYVIWGSVTVVGEDASLDVRVCDKKGKVWPQSRQAKASALISVLSGVSDAVNQEVFGRAAMPASGRQSAQGAVNQMNPDITVNQTSSKDVYLNPQFRYAGPSAGDDSRLRSQALPFSSIGMEVVDADGDGRNEVFLLAETTLRAYVFSNGQLSPVGEFNFPKTDQCLNIRSFPHPSGKAWLIVNAVDNKGYPQASVLTYSGGRFTEEMKNIHLYLNVVKLPPTYMPVIIGQEAQPPRLFKEGVSEMIKSGKSLERAKRLALPTDANVFNFAYLPAGRGGKDGEKLIVLSSDERLRTYTGKGARLSESSERFSGSAVGLSVDPAMPGLGREIVTIGNVFYIPMRMLAVDLERDGNYELIVNKPISTASEIFDRYRFFPQSEIHSLFWDGIGLNLQWKTRRIKGSTVDYTIADVNNDGVPALVVCLNTHPGAIGVAARKTMLMVYPLDLSKTDPGAAVDRTDVHDVDGGGKR
ncbi:MAG: VCBS repeat-containing protein [Desulfovibrio sp.]|jgi:hypothetical protein|nr:VCBS repeat-containing protein [Desulfovibrio sp.]